MVTLGVVGAGNWGPNVIRAFAKTPGCALKVVCDKDPAKLAKMQAELPHLRYSTSYTDLLQDPELDAVAIATDVPSHFELATAALKAGKHLFVEKPLTRTAQEAQSLLALGKQTNRLVVVDHLLLHHAAIRHLKRVIDGGELGRVLYLKAARTNLGKVRTEENVLWSFAPHDISVILYLLNGLPTSVSAQGQAFVTKGVEDLVFLTLRFASGQLAHIHVSWLDPKKERKVVIVGDAKMAIFDDLEAQEKIRLYDCGVDPLQGKFTDYSGALTTRFGDIHIPAIKEEEPLLAIAKHFVGCVSGKVVPAAPEHEAGLHVLRVLEAAQKSLKNGGMNVGL